MAGSGPTDSAGLCQHLQQKEQLRLLGCWESTPKQAAGPAPQGGGAAGAAAPQLPAGPHFTEFAETQIFRQKIIVTLCI